MIHKNYVFFHYHTPILVIPGGWQQFPNTDKGTNLYLYVIKMNMNNINNFFGYLQCINLQKIYYNEYFTESPENKTNIVTTSFYKNENDNDNDKYVLMISSFHCFLPSRMLTIITMKPNILIIKNKISHFIVRIYIPDIINQIHLYGLRPNNKIWAIDCPFKKNKVVYQYIIYNFEPVVCRRPCVICTRRAQSCI